MLKEIERTANLAVHHTQGDEQEEVGHLTDGHTFRTVTHNAEDGKQSQRHSRADALSVMDYFRKNYSVEENAYGEWLEVCGRIAKELDGIDCKKYNHYVEKISSYVPENTIITTDVGQNQVWIAQSYRVKRGQRILFSGGHGAMGYSLPAAIGAYYATHKPVICFNGDGGLQMNIQELAFIRRERLPIKVFVFNNYALGMIRHFQEMYFESNYVQTVKGMGYDTPDCT